MYNESKRLKVVSDDLHAERSSHYVLVFGCENAARRKAAVPSVQPFAPHTKCDGVHALFGGDLILTAE